ncbi:ABC transporter permease [Sporosarcina jiandibaonis]|uniref:ABC transporter permease n=1 Tax=Sporosarcina jiandibaonis TaxID=2715535 RepID=UPI0031B5C800
MHAFWEVITKRSDLLITGLLQHIFMTVVTMSIVLIIAVPLGIYLTKNAKLADSIIGITGVFQTIPSIALFGFLLPVVGIGLRPTIIALVMFGLLPVLRNVYTGINEVDEHLVSAGKGMGMTDRQILTMIELPLALPVIMAGIRTATVMTIGVATIAAFIGAGGLGEIIFRGVSLMRNELILAGAIPAAAFALIADFSLKRIEIWVSPNNKKRKTPILQKKLEVIRREVAIKK